MGRGRGSCYYSGPSRPVVTRYIPADLRITVYIRSVENEDTRTYKNRCHADPKTGYRVWLVAVRMRCFVDAVIKCMMI